MDYFIENYYEEPVETDEEYEFEASQYFDFTRPEIDLEIEEVERWFEVSGDYDPSHFIVKLNLETLLSTEISPNAPNSSSKNAKSSNRHGVSTSNKSVEGKSAHVVHDTAKAKTKFDYQPRSSTLMKPTASHLAKQNKQHDIQSNCSTICSNRTSINLSEKSLSSIGFDNTAIKRQKLDIGYLRKIAHLKHHIALVHKSSKKVTVPREFELQTLLRSQRRSSKNSSVSSENEKENRRGSNFKALPLNRKVLQASSLPQIRKSTQQLTQIHMFQLKTTERANQHAAKASNVKNADRCVSDGVTDSKRLNSIETSKPQKSRSLTQKLSLGPEIEDQLMSPSETDMLDKELKEKAENAHDSFQSEFWKSHTKPNQCGDHLRVHDKATCWSSLNRELGIH